MHSFSLHLYGLCVCRWGKKREVFSLQLNGSPLPSLALPPYQAGSCGSLFAWLNGIRAAGCTPDGKVTQGKTESSLTCSKPLVTQSLEMSWVSHQITVPSLVLKNISHLDCVCWPKSIVSKFQLTNHDVKVLYQGRLGVSIKITSSP